MSSLANQILKQNFCLSATGQQIPLHSHTSRAQCQFLVDLIRQCQARQTLEIGVAFGISSLFICEEIAARQGHHILIDPHQNDRHWQGIGLKNLFEAGFSESIELYEEDARIVLPRLADANNTLDFAYVDASKRLDDTLIFFFFIFRMLRVGGIIAFDDVACFPGISLALRYIVQMPGVEVVGIHGQAPTSASRRAVEFAARLMPGSLRLMAAEWVTPARKLRINAACVAIRKTSNDIGNWDYHPLGV